MEINYNKSCGHFDVIIYFSQNSTKVSISAVQLDIAQMTSRPRLRVLFPAGQNLISNRAKKPVFEK
jgi:hypothetical protein